MQAAAAAAVILVVAVLECEINQYMYNHDNEDNLTVNVSEP